MSTKSKKSASKGVRYTPEQKKEVIDFVANYNAQNGRGGQSAASKKFGVTPLTISAWQKALGSSAPKGKKAAKVAKAKKSPKIVSESASSSSGKSRGTRYSPEEKQQIVDFVNNYNAENGRGGQSAAVKKFNLSAITVSAWLKKAGVRSTGGRPAKQVRAAAAPAAPVVSSGIASKIGNLLDISDDIRKAEGELAKLRAKYDALSASIRAAI